MLYFLVGFLLGTLVDYLFHRLIGHGPGSEASNAQLLCRHSLSHHKVFTDRRGMTAKRGETRRSQLHLQLRAVFILLLLVAVAVGVGMSAGGILGVEDAEPFLWMGGGLLLALVSYEILHTLHHSRLPPWLANVPGYKQARAWHHDHHREPDSRFGVLLPMWDYVFFTHRGLNEDVEEAAPGPEAVPDTRPEPTRPRTGKRSRPSTSMKDLLAATMAEADAEAADEQAGTLRKRRAVPKKKPPTTPGRGKGD